MCRQKRTSACHSLHRNAEADPTLDEGPGTETSQTSPVDGASLHLLQVDPRRRGGDTAQGLSVPPALITLPLAAFHNKPGDTAAVVELLPPQPLRTSANERADEREAHVASQAPSLSLFGTADGDRVSAFAKDAAPRIGQTDLLAPAQGPAVAGGCVARHVTFSPRPGL